MSNLVLTRTARKSVRLEMLPGVFLKLTVAYVGGDQIKLELVASDGSTLTKRLNVGSQWSVGEGLVVTLLGIQYRQAKLSFDAPLNVKIVRTELLERVAAL